MFDKEYVLDSGKVIKQSGRPTLIKLIIALCFVLAVIVSGLFTGFSMSTLIQNGGKFFDITSEMFPFILSFDGGVSVNTDVFTYFIETTIEIMPDLIVTINMAFIGTLIGAVIAFFIGMATASNTNPERFSRTILKLIMTLIRTLPVLVMAIILTYIFGIGEFAGVIAIIIFSVGILAKMFYEFIETVSMAPSEAAMASGSTRIKSNNATVIPQVIPQYISLSLYTFEINIRAAAILGYVGAGGIGQLLKDDMALRNYQHVGVIVIWMLIVVIIVDGFSNFVRRRLING